MFGKSIIRSVAVCLALALGTALLYLPVLHFDFVNVDDPLYVLNNFHIRTANWETIRWCFETTYAHLWHPLTWISHMLDFQLYGFWPGGHHATNVVLHIFNSTLLFVILKRMTHAFWRSAMVAALFAWHPLHVESVAWIAERKDVLSAFFWMLTIWTYVRYVEDAKAHNSRRKVFYALSLCFFALGLMAKPMLVTLPFVLLLLDGWPLQRLQPAASMGPEKIEPIPTRPMLGLVVEKLPFLVLSILACVITMRVTGPVAAHLPLPTRLGIALLGYLRYVEKMIWPQNLVVVYPFEHPLPGSEVIMAGLFVIVISVAAIRLWKVRPFWLVGWLLYLGILVPVIGFVQAGNQPMADRYTYLPSIGIFIIFCWEFWDIASGWPHGLAIVRTVAAAVLAGCLVLSAKQLQYWRNPNALFSHNIEASPNNYMAHAGYATYLRDTSQFEAARLECDKTLRLAPYYARAHQLLGEVLFKEGSYDKADPELHLALRLDPKRMDIHMDLGDLALARNSPVDAAAQYGLLLAADAVNPQARCGLGQALARQGKLDEAHAEYVEALRLASGFFEPHFQMGVLQSMQHHSADAISEYRTALSILPNRPDALNNLAWLLATDSRPENRNGAEAVKLALQACALTGNQQAALIGTLAAAYAEDGRFDDAVKAAQEAHDLAQKQGNKDVAARNLELLELYRSRHAYHEK